MNWIKCSDRQPSKSGSYLATYKIGGAYYVDFISYYKMLWDDEDDGYNGWATRNDVVAWIDEELKPYKPTTGLQTVVVHIEGAENSVEVFSRLSTAITNAVEKEGYVVGVLSSSWKEGGDK